MTLTGPVRSVQEFTTTAVYRRYVDNICVLCATNANFESKLNGKFGRDLLKFASHFRKLCNEEKFVNNELFVFHSAPMILAHAEDPPKPRTAR